jgi:hypothetical protein
MFSNHMVKTGLLSAQSYRDCEASMCAPVLVAYVYGDSGKT